MILKAIMLFQSNNTFDGDFGDEPEPYSLTLGVDPHIYMPALIAIFLILVVWVLARAFGEGAAHRKVRDAKRGAAEALYEEINAALDRALRAPGGYQLDKARELRDLVQARFGYVIALTTKPGKTLESLEKALESDEGKLETHASTAAKVKVAMASEEHRLVVWQSLQKFRQYWDRKEHILALIEAAQHETGAAPQRRLRTGQAGTGAAAVKTKKAEPIVVPPAAVAPIPEKSPEKPPEAPPEKTRSGDDDKPPPPPPPPPAPPPGRGKKLPAHKRNMLA